MKTKDYIRILGIKKGGFHQKENYEKINIHYSASIYFNNM